MLIAASDTIADQVSRKNLSNKFEKSKFSKMAECSPPNVGNVEKRFPYKIFNDLAMKLRAAENKIIEERKHYEAKIANMLEIELSRDALENDVAKLKQRISDLVYENNRYHLSISYCTVCATDAAGSEVYSTSDVSITACALVTSSLDTLETSISPVLCPDVPSSVFPTFPSPPLLSKSVETRQADSVVKSKEKNFILKMLKTLTKLEKKYLTPEHKRKKRLFTRKEKTSPIVPKEFDSIYHVLSAPEPDAVTVADPFPHVRWNDVRFKPALPNPEQCPIHSCSSDPVFYVDRESPSFQCNFNFDYLASQNGRPFGALPGFKTNLGTVAIPSTPVGGYVYCPDARKWVIFAEARSPPSTGRGTRREGATSLARRRGG